MIGLSNSGKIFVEFSIDTMESHQNNHQSVDPKTNTMYVQNAWEKDIGCRSLKYINGDEEDQEVPIQSESHGNIAKEKEKSLVTSPALPSAPHGVWHLSIIVIPVGCTPPRVLRNGYLPTYLQRGTKM